VINCEERGEVGDVHNRFRCGADGGNIEIDKKDLFTTYLQFLGAYYPAADLGGAR